MAEQLELARELAQMARDFASAGEWFQATRATAAAASLARMGSIAQRELEDLRRRHEQVVRSTNALAEATRRAASDFGEAQRATLAWSAALNILNAREREAASAVFDWTKSTRADRYREGLERRRELWDSWLEQERERQEQETEMRALQAQRGADAYTATWERAFDDMRSMAERALQVRMQPTELDFLQTALGQYENAPLEAVRRLDAIIARGFAELQAHPDWPALLKIPDDVLAAGENALRAWAMRTRDAVANLARPDLIDWHAFVNEFRRLQEQEAARTTTLDIAMQKLAEAGLVSDATRAAARGQVASMLGLDTPDILAQTMAGGFTQAFTTADPAGLLLQHMQKRIDGQKQAYTELGKRAGTWLGDAIHDAALTELDNFLPDLARRISPYLVLPGGSPPP
jgi:hypothetical protein